MTAVTNFFQRFADDPVNRENPARIEVVGDPSRHGILLHEADGFFVQPDAKKAQNRYRLVNPGVG